MENESKNQNYMEIYYPENGISIRFVYTDNGGINILDSYEIKDDYYKMRFLNDIMDANKYCTYFGKRNLYSLFTEWKAHNILYKKKIFRKRTSDTGLNPREGRIRRLFYRFVCFMFSE